MDLPTSMPISLPRRFELAGLAGELWEPARYKVLYGGRGGGKSYLVADLLLLAGVVKRERILCAREIQTSIKESVHRLLVDRMSELGLRQFYRVLSDRIEGANGTVFLFKGLRHNVDNLKSMAGLTKVWVEEAQSVAEASWATLIPTVREPGSEIWLTLNPGRRSDATSQRFLLNPPKNAFIRQINWNDNPHFPETLNQERLADKAARADTYAHVWEGAFDTVGARALIPYAWIEAAVGLAEELGLKIDGRRYAALDVAGSDKTGDANALALRHGISLAGLETWNGLDTSATTQRAVRAAHTFGALECYYDAIGLGEGVTGEWAAMRRRGDTPEHQSWHPWNGSATVLTPEARLEPDNPHSPTHGDQYENLKAQGWFALRRRFWEAYKARTGQAYDDDLLISLPPDVPGLERLMAELAQPQQTLSHRGKTQVDKQPDGAPSPNLADAVMMAFWPCRAPTYDMAVLG